MRKQVNLVVMSKSYVSSFNDSLLLSATPGSSNDFQQRPVRVAQGHLVKRNGVFSCSACPYTVGQRTKLEMHLINCHGTVSVDPWKCLQCGMSYVKKGSMMNHMLNKHGVRNLSDNDSENNSGLNNSIDASEVGSNRHGIKGSIQTPVSRTNRNGVRDSSDDSEAERNRQNSLSTSVARRSKQELSDSSDDSEAEKNRQNSLSTSVARRSKQELSDSSDDSEAERNRQNSLSTSAARRSKQELSDSSDDSEAERNRQNSLSTSVARRNKCRVRDSSDDSEAERNRQKSSSTSVAKRNKCRVRDSEAGRNRPGIRDSIQTPNAITNNHGVREFSDDSETENNRKTRDAVRYSFEMPKTKTFDVADLSESDHFETGRSRLNIRDSMSTSVVRRNKRSLRDLSSASKSGSKKRGKRDSASNTKKGRNNKRIIRDGILVARRNEPCIRDDTQVARRSKPCIRDDTQVARRNKPCLGNSIDNQKMKNMKHVIIKSSDDSEVGRNKCTASNSNPSAGKSQVRNVSRYVYSQSSDSDTEFYDEGFDQTVPATFTKAAVECYQCKSCSYKTQYKAQLLRHERFHDKFHPFKCNKCGFSTKASHGMLRHLQVVHKITKIQSSHFTELDHGLTSHAAVTGENTKVQVKQLHADSGRCSSSKNTSLEHNQSAHAECKLCGLQAAYRKNVLKHLVSVHKISKDCSSYCITLSTNDNTSKNGQKVEEEWSSSDDFETKKKTLKKVPLNNSKKDLLAPCSKSSAVLEDQTNKFLNNGNVHRKRRLTFKKFTRICGALPPSYPVSESKNSNKIAKEGHAQATNGKMKFAGAWSASTLGHRKVFICRLCCKVFQSKYCLERHKVSHTDLRRYQCPVCGWRSNFKYSIKKHMASRHDNNCEPVVEMSINEASKSIVSYKLQAVREKSVLNRSEKSNEIDVSLSSVNVTGRKLTNSSVQCPTCSALFSSENSLRSHKQVHENLQRYQCDACGLRRNLRSTLRHHVKKYHAGMTSITVLSTAQASEKINPHMSSARGVKVRHPSLLSKGLAGKKSEERFQYPSLPSKGLTRKKFQHPSLPNKGLADKKSVERFQHPSLPNKCLAGKKRSVEKFLQCSFCPVKLGDKDSLRVHLKRHENIGYQCNICGLQRKWRSTMHLHLRKMHGGNATYIRVLLSDAKSMIQGHKKCETPPQQSTLRADEVTGYRSPEHNRRSKCFSCKICNRRFSRSEKLQKHLIVHSDLRRYQCLLCNWRTNFKGNLNSHVMNIHEVQPSSSSTQVLSIAEAKSTISAYKNTTTSHNKFCNTQHSKKVLDSKSDKKVDKTESNFEPIVDDDSRTTVHRVAAHSECANGNFPVEIPVQQSHQFGLKEDGQVSSHAHHLRHMKNSFIRHGKRCRFCSFRSNWSSGLQRHEQVAHCGQQVPKLLDEENLSNKSLAVVKEQKNDGNGVESGVVKPLTNIDTQGLRRFLCGMCGFRSNYRWDVTKHQKTKHGSVLTVFIMKDEEARETLDFYVASRLHKRSFSRNVALAAIGSKTSLTKVQASQGKEVLEPLTNIDTQGLRRFLCGMCGFRSNYRWDVTKHQKMKHGSVLTVFIMKDEEARETLDFYVASRLHKRSSRNVALATIGSKTNLAEVQASQGDVIPAGENSPEIVNVASLLHKGLLSPKIHLTPCNTDSTRDITPVKELSVAHKMRTKPVSCFSCDFKTIWPESLRRHVASRHNQIDVKLGKDSPVCGGKQASSINLLARKAIGVNANTLVKFEQTSKHDEIYFKRFSCSLCHFRSSFRHSVFRHICFRHAKGTAFLKVLSKKLICRSPLTKSFISKIPKSQASEPIVSAVDGKSGELSVHEVEVVEQLNTKNCMFSCNKCPFSTRLSYKLVLHKAQHRPKKGALLKCLRCAFFCRSGTTLKKHAALHQRHDTVRPKINAAPAHHKTVEMALFKQRLINSRLSTSVEARGCALTTAPSSHQEAVDSVQHWQCDRCPYSVDDMTCFRRHVSLHGVNHRYSCHYCNYSVPSCWRLLQHHRLHFHENKNLLGSQSVTNLFSLPQRVTASGSSPAGCGLLKSIEESQDFTSPNFSLFRCSRCPFATSCRQEFCVHARGHVPGVCVFCDYNTGSSTHLHSHLMLHFNLPGCEMSCFPPHSRSHPLWTTVIGGIEEFISSFTAEQCSEKVLMPSNSLDNMVESQLEVMLLLEIMVETVASDGKCHQSIASIAQLDSSCQSQLLSEVSETILARGHSSQLCDERVNEPPCDDTTVCDERVKMPPCYDVAVCDDRVKMPPCDDAAVCDERVNEPQCDVMAACDERVNEQPCDDAAVCDERVNTPSCDDAFVCDERVKMPPCDDAAVCDHCDERVNTSPCDDMVVCDERVKTPPCDDAAVCDERVKTPSCDDAFVCDERVKMPPCDDAAVWEERVETPSCGDVVMCDTRVKTPPCDNAAVCYERVNNQPCNEMICKPLHEDLIRNCQTNPTMKTELAGVLLKTGDIITDSSLINMSVEVLSNSFTKQGSQQYANVLDSESCIVLLETSESSEILSSNVPSESPMIMMPDLEAPFFPAKSSMILSEVASLMMPEVEAPPPLFLVSHPMMMPEVEAPPPLFPVSRPMMIPEMEAPPPFFLVSHPMMMPEVEAPPPLFPVSRPMIMPEVEAPPPLFLFSHPMMMPEVEAPPPLFPVSRPMMMPEVKASPPLFPVSCPMMMPEVKPPVLMVMEPKCCEVKSFCQNKSSTLSYCCKYCDRPFSSSLRLQIHEDAHLMGNCFEL